MRRCTRCKQEKEPDDFYKEPRRPAGLTYECRACAQARGRERYRLPEVKARTRENELKRTYGLTLALFDQMWLDQGEACAICHRHAWKEQKGTPFVDHNHDTGKIRGLLCGACNSLLGYARDDPATLMRAALYLEDHRSVQLEE